MDASPSILIVEDDRGIASLMRGVFEDEGFDVRSAPTGEHGLELLAERRPDVIVLDLMLPGISGMGFLERIRGEGDMTPVVIASALRGAQQIAEQGGARFIAKPFDLDQLVSLVRDAAGA